MSGQHGPLAPPPAPTAPCREPESATVHLMGAQSAMAAGKSPPTAFLRSVQVIKGQFFFIFESQIRAKRTGSIIPIAVQD